VCLGWRTSVLHGVGGGPQGLPVPLGIVPVGQLGPGYQLLVGAPLLQESQLICGGGGGGVDEQQFFQPSQGDWLRVLVHCTEHKPFGWVVCQLVPLDPSERT